MSEQAALAALDRGALAADLAELVRAPSLTGRERPALELLAALADRAGLAPELLEHDLGALRAAAGHPGEEAPRDELLNLTVTLPGRGRGRLCLNGHVDVVSPGSEPWRHGDAFSGTVEDGRLFGRGAVDMKAGVMAALHALAALRSAGVAPPAETVLLCVSSEEDGGLGTFAALERDDRFDAAVIPEPTGWDVVCAQAGALTFRGVVRGRAAHAGVRLEGRSALDRYVGLHRRLAEHEEALNADVAHPLMRRLALPYPVSVGRIEGGAWSSQVPDRVSFEGRVGVRLGEPVEAAMSALAAVLDDGEEPPVELSWQGGRFAPGQTPPDHPLVRLLSDAVRDERGAAAQPVGVPYGADMRLFCERGIPCAMVGTPGIERAHALDEWVDLDEVLALARVLVRVVARFAA